MIKDIKHFNFSIKSIKNFNNYYCDINGKVFKKSNNKELIGSINNQGYLVVNLKDINNKNHTIYIHHLIYFIFSNEERKVNYEIDHIDNNKLNNSFNNLRYVKKNENLNNRKNRTCFRSEKTKMIKYLKILNIETLEQLKNYLNCNDLVKSSQEYIE